MEATTWNYISLMCMMSYKYKWDCINMHKKNNMIIMNINSASECVCARACVCKEVYMHSCVLVKSNLKNGAFY